MEEGDLKIFNALNAAMDYFKEGCSKRGMSTDSKDWSLPRDTGKDAWGVTVFDYKRARPDEKLLKTGEKKFDVIYTGFVHNETRFWIDLGQIFKRLVNIRRHEGFVAELLYIWWPNRGITEEQFSDLINRYRTPYAKEIGNALFHWVYGSTFETATKFGNRLYKYIQYFPAELRKAPHTLYRAIKIDKNLFEKLRSGKKKHIDLKERMYTSWSSAQAAVRDFGRRFSHEAQQQGQVVVILRKNFIPDEILLNIRKACQFYGCGAVFTEEESEIAVRVPGGLKLNASNLFQYLEKGTWKPVGGEEQKDESFS